MYLQSRWVYGQYGVRLTSNKVNFVEAEGSVETHGTAQSLIRNMEVRVLVDCLLLYCQSTVHLIILLKSIKKKKKKTNLCKCEICISQFVQHKNSHNLLTKWISNEKKRKENVNKKKWFKS